MSEQENIPMSTTKTALIISIVIIVILAASNIWFLTSPQGKVKPKLVKIYLSEEDVRPRNGESYLHVMNVLVNFGSNTAQECKLHVVLYQGNVVAKETDIIAGSIEGEGWKFINEKIYYEGEALTSFTVMPEWKK